MSHTFSPGDVLDYIPDERWGNHCREGIAIVNESGYAVDTFWGGYGGGNEHYLNEKEVETAGLLFRIGDYRKLGDHWGHHREEWLTYAPCDRQVITSQHRLQQTYYVRSGAEPNFATQIANAREAVREAERAVASAQLVVEWRREDLAKLENTGVTP
jgi:hypothetical protein